MSAYKIMRSYNSTKKYDFCINIINIYFNKSKLNLKINISYLKKIVKIAEILDKYIM